MDVQRIVDPSTYRSPVEEPKRPSVRCAGTRQDGSRCHGVPLQDEDYCRHHTDQRSARSASSARRRTGRADARNTDKVATRRVRPRGSSSVLVGDRPMGAPGRSLSAAQAPRRGSAMVDDRPAGAPGRSLRRNRPAPTPHHANPRKAHPNDARAEPEPRVRRVDRLGIPERFVDETADAEAIATTVAATDGESNADAWTAYLGRTPDAHPEPAAGAETHIGSAPPAEADTKTNTDAAVDDQIDLTRLYVTRPDAPSSVPRHDVEQVVDWTSRTKDAWEATIHRVDEPLAADTTPAPPGNGSAGTEDTSNDDAETEATPRFAWPLPKAE